MKTAFIHLLVMAGIAFAAGCASSPIHYSNDHAIFLEKAKAGWSWK